MGPIQLSPDVRNDQSSEPLLAVASPKRDVSTQLQPSRPLSAGLFFMVAPSRLLRELDLDVEPPASNRSSPQCHEALPGSSSPDRNNGSLLRFPIWVFPLSNAAHPAIAPPEIGGSPSFYGYRLAHQNGERQCGDC